MKPYGQMLAMAAAALLAQSCLIENDMSYPRILANVIAFAVEGQESCSIDADSRTVTIVLEETADPASLKVTESAVSEGVSSTDFPKADAIIDLTETRTYTLSTYQDYIWTVTAVQPVDRYIRCENQGSSPIINSEIVMGVAFMLFFTTFAFPNGYTRLILGHITFCTPYVVLSVMPRRMAPPAWGRHRSITCWAIS